MRRLVNAIGARRGAGLPAAVLSAVATLLAAAGAPAETLDDAWRAALAGDAQLEAAHSRTLAAGATREAVRAERRPTLTASISASVWRDTPAFDFAAAGVPFALPLFGGNTFSMADVRVGAPLYTGGAVRANLTAADAAVAQGERAVTALEQDVKLAVATAYVNVQRTRSALGVAQATAASLAAHAADVADMQRAGQVPRNDYLAAAVALADAEQRELDRGNAFAIAQAAYNRELARPLDAAVELAPLEPGAAEPQDLEQLIGAALAERAELASLDAAAAELGARADAARAVRRPQVAVSGGYTFVENQVLDAEDFWSVGVGFRWSPFDGGRARHSAEAFDQQSAAAVQERKHLQSLIELDVRRAWLDVGAARARRRVAEAAVAQAEENLRVARDRYRGGEGTNSEVLDAEALRALSAGNFDDARYGAALAGFRLERAVGRL